MLTTGNPSEAPAADAAAHGTSHGGRGTRSDRGSVRRALLLKVGSAGYRLPVPIQRAIAVRDGASVIVAGGLDGSGTTVGGVFRMDPTTGTLTALGNLPRPVHDGAGAMIGGRLFVFGGGSTAGTDLVQAFDPSTGKGAVVGHLPVSLSDLSAVSIGATVYLVGGLTDRSLDPRCTPPGTACTSSRWRRSLSGCGTRP